MRRSICIAFALVSAQAMAAEVAALPERLAAARYALSLDDGRLSDNGGQVIRAALKDARYVLIGEEHFTREVPAFAAAVCDQMADLGLAAIAVEAGPSAADLVNRSLASDARLTMLRDTTARYPDSMAFVNGTEESDWLAHCARSVAPGKLAVWGLDQEFLGAAARLFDLMLATHPGPGATEALRRLRSAEQTVGDRARETGDPSPLWLLKASDADVEALRVVIDREGDAEARRLFVELAESRTIYRENNPSPAKANRDRALLMKRHLAERLGDGFGAERRVLFKFGAYHLYKGYNPLAQLDLGTYVSERADGEGARSLHIAVLGAGGEHGVYGGYGRPLTIAPIDWSAEDESPYLRPFMDARFGDGWTLYDLRLVRQGALGTIDPALRDFIRGYDLLVIVPRFSAGTLIR